MPRGMLFCIAMSILCLPSLLGSSGSADTRAAVWIYRDYPQPGTKDDRGEAERMFSPFGFMPASRTNQITVDQQMLIDEDDATKGTCIEYYFEFKRRDDWVGSYTLVGGNAWGTKRGINVQDVLGVKPDTIIVVCLTSSSSSLSPSGRRVLRVMDFLLRGVIKS